MIAEAGLVGQRRLRAFAFANGAANLGFLIHSEPPERPAVVAKSQPMKRSATHGSLAMVREKLVAPVTNIRLPARPRKQDGTVPSSNPLRHAVIRLE
jgi:hypothetical protein